MLPRIQAGQTRRVFCAHCLSQFDLTYEPTHTDAPGDEPAPEEKVIQFCPFCAEEQLFDQGGK